VTMLAWYVHHEGRGHASRALAFATASSTPVTLVSELDLSELWPDTVRLPPDAPEAPGPARRPSTLPDPTVRGRLHWAPLTPERLAPRASAMVEVLNQASLEGLVTDVSVEAGLLARLCGVPVVAVHELGRRDDAAHDLGRACSAGLLAPYPEALADPAVDPGHPAVFHTGFVPMPCALRDADRAEARRRLSIEDGPAVVVALGAGGHGARTVDLEHLAASLPEAHVIVVGRPQGLVAGRSGLDLRVDGWVADIGDHLVAADVVVASAGASIVAEVAAARRPLVCVPEMRPFAEQEERARRLSARGVARTVASWADGRNLVRSVADALGEDGSAWDAIDTGPGPKAAVDWVLDRLGDARAGFA
jgi:UDP-N-acetylglucosamine--N-acetylmuramyl-(pentapeptide) pyrophosphoryl-undecaprenol N-acetylglucosamine transferase